MEIESNYRRKLSDLSLIDDYLFGLFVQEAGSEELLKELVEHLLDIKISKVSLKQKQHEISSEPDFHGIRLDAFLSDDSDTLYDIEVQTSNHYNIPKRMRYYQSLIDREQMPSGEYDYSKLKKTIIVFITNFDLFGKGLYRYTFENVCTEDKTLLLEDESIKVVLNTKGTDPTGVAPELVELLEYFHNSNKETADKLTSDFVKRLDKSLEPIKNSPKFGGAYMSYQEVVYAERKMGEKIGEERGILKGLEKGRQEGEERGILKGLEKGRQEGEEKGRLEERSKLKARLRKQGMSEQEIRLLLD